MLKISPVLISWIFLIIAVVLECLATMFFKLENIFFALFAMAVLIALSYYFMALCLNHIKISVAYAFWELLGALLILSVSFFIFKESLTTKQILGVIFALSGIILLNYSELKK